MPFYDYECKQCQTVFEVRATIAEKETGLDPACPQCHKRSARQILTSGVQLLRRSGGGPACGPNAGPGCCG